MTKPIAETKTEAAPASGTEARKLPVIRPEAAVVNYSGNAFKELVARLPQDATADDLKEPGIWASIQTNQMLALRKMDRVVCVAYDESFIWEAYVAEAGPSGVTLSTPKRHEMKSRSDVYFNDGTYRVSWGGVGFNVIRVSDGREMSTNHANELLAIKALQNLYPRAVA